MNDIFYEIEYNASPIPGVGKFVRKAREMPIEPRKPDKIRDRFSQMRDIGRERGFYAYRSRFFDKRFLHEKAFVFYKQAIYMSDFTDDYKETTAYAAYYPSYQMMSYEQLRTYFTWRTRVREGVVSDISLSYAFLYIYELLMNIGSSGSADALEKLMFFREKYRVFNDTIDKYLVKCWLKDYHIYYELMHTFEEFSLKYGLIEHYANLFEKCDANGFEFLCGLSNYNIKKSAFFTDENAGFISDCLLFVTERIKNRLAEAGLDFDDLIYHSPEESQKQAEYEPFKSALFYHWHKQTDRLITLSDKEMYICRDNRFYHKAKNICKKSGKQFVGYIIKKTEAELRAYKGFKYKLSADGSLVPPLVQTALSAANTSMGRIIENTVREFCAEAARIVVTINESELRNVREETLNIQKKLIIPEDDCARVSADTPPARPLTETANAGANINVWSAFANALTETERSALIIALNDNALFAAFAVKNGVMPEVLAEGINEKALEYIGDNLLDEYFSVYEEYAKNIVTGGNNEHI